MREPSDIQGFPGSPLEFTLAKARAEMTKTLRFLMTKTLGFLQSHLTVLLIKSSE
jgi:hypothetical protein